MTMVDGLVHFSGGETPMGTVAATRDSRSPRRTGSAVKRIKAEMEASRRWTPPRGPSTILSTDD